MPRPTYDFPADGGLADRQRLTLRFARDYAQKVEKLEAYRDERDHWIRRAVAHEIPIKAVARVVNLSQRRVQAICLMEADDD